MNQILKQSRVFQANEASDVIDHVLLAKRIKLRYSASMRDVSFFLIKASKPRCRTSHHYCYLYRKRTRFKSQSSDCTVHNKFAFMNYTDEEHGG